MELLGLCCFQKKNHVCLPELKDDGGWYLMSLQMVFDESPIVSQWWFSKTTAYPDFFHFWKSIAHSF